MKRLHKSFMSLNPGCLFEFHGSLYIKLNKDSQSEFTALSATAVSVLNGLPAFFRLDDFVVVRDDVHPNITEVTK